MIFEFPLQEVSGFELLTLILLHHADVPEMVTYRWLPGRSDGSRFIL
jgi:hypothetical protein